MITLAILRVGTCEICTGTMYLPEGDYLPAACVHCGSTEWLYGPEPLDGVRIRMKIRRKRRTLNPGAKSKKRQDRAKAQWRQLKPKDAE